MYAEIRGTTHLLEMPPAEAELLPGIRWGAFDELFTPAFWFGQCWQHENLGTYSQSRLGRTLAEEVSACLLGGFGIKAEMGLMAFRRLRDWNLLLGCPSEEDLSDALATPFQIAGRTRHYRFPTQKARYLSACLAALHDYSEPENDLALRDSLLDLPGIGPKTASWIVRNHRCSDQVAIIDIHILRAGRHIGIFEPKLGPAFHYSTLEDAFLKFAEALGRRAAMLDALIWDYVRRLAPGRTFDLLQQA